MLGWCLPEGDDIVSPFLKVEAIALHALQHRDGLSSSVARGRRETCILRNQPRIDIK